MQTDLHAAETFDQWWDRIGFSLDPDTQDVDWYDKRKEFAMYAWDAARDYLATHPADDAEGIDDRPFLESLSFKHDGGSSRSSRLEVSDAFEVEVIGCHVFINHIDTSDGYLAIKNATRLQLRDLLAALGVVVRTYHEKWLTESGAVDVTALAQRQTPTLAHLIDGLTLEWGNQIAETQFGDYCIEWCETSSCDGYWQCRGPSMPIVTCGTVESGESLCLEHYKSRVRAIFSKGA